MSFWLWPTTADVGMRVFAPSLPRLFEESALGVQHYLMSSPAAKSINEHLRHTGEWRIQSPHDPNDHAFLFIAWLEEILYKAEVHNQWLVDVQCKVVEGQDGLEIVAHVEWIDANSVEREIEIKAVTTHQLTVREVERGAIIVSDWPDVPTFEGPGWYADVVFDI